MCKAGGTRSYCYDATGNLTADNAGLAIRYDHTQRPLKITRSSLTQYFDYAPDGMRFRQSGSDGEVAYFGALERRYLPAANDKTYVGGSVVVTTTATTRRVDTLLTDRLGSVDALANSSGALLETRGFDAFGKPRNGVWADTTPPRLATTSNTPHGFTGHEHLNSLELIHMNGRVYDYNLGRFMGVDPVIQFPLNSQSLNPYSYILNNPLSGTDPTGYAACSDVALGGAGSGSCDHELSNGDTVSVDYKVGKSGVSVSTSSSNFSAIAADNATRSANGAQSAMGAGPDGKQTTSSSAYKINAADTQPSTIQEKKGGLQIDGDEDFVEKVQRVEEAALKAGITVFDDLRQGNRLVIIRESEIDQIGMGRISGNVIVEWDPDEAALVVKSSVGRDTRQYQSPALGLIHELVELKAVELECGGERNVVPDLDLKDVRHVDISRMRVYSSPSVNDETLVVELMTSVEIPFLIDCHDGTRDASAEFLFGKEKYILRQLRAGFSGEMKGYARLSEICATQLSK